MSKLLVDRDNIRVENLGNLPKFGTNTVTLRIWQARPGTKPFISLMPVSPDMLIDPRLEDLLLRLAREIEPPTELE